MFIIRLCQLKSLESLVSNTDWIMVGWCLSAIEILHWSNDKIVEPIKNNWIFSTEETISFLTEKIVCLEMIFKQSVSLLLYLRWTCLMSSF